MYAIARKNIKKQLEILSNDSFVQLLSKLKVILFSILALLKKYEKYQSKEFSTIQIFHPKHFPNFNPKNFIPRKFHSINYEYLKISFVLSHIYVNELCPRESFQLLSANYNHLIVHICSSKRHFEGLKLAIELFEDVMPVFESMIDLLRNLILSPNDSELQASLASYLTLNPSPYVDTNECFEACLIKQIQYFLDYYLEHRHPIQNSYLNVLAKVCELLFLKLHRNIPSSFYNLLLVIFLNFTKVCWKSFGIENVYFRKSI